MFDESLLDSIRTDFILNILSYAKTLLPKGIKTLNNDLCSLTHDPVNHSEAPNLKNVTLNAPVTESVTGTKEFGEQFERVSIEDDAALCDLQIPTSTSELTTSNPQVSTKKDQSQKSANPLPTTWRSSVSSTTVKEPSSFSPVSTGTQAEFSNFTPVSTSTVTEFSSFSPESANTNTVPSIVSPVVNSILCESTTTSSTSISTPQTLTITSPALNNTRRALCSPISNSAEAEFSVFSPVLPSTEEKFSSFSKVSSANTEAEFVRISPTLDDSAAVSSSLSSAVSAMPSESISISSSSIKLPQELPINLSVSDRIPWTLTIISTALDDPHGIFPIEPPVPCRPPQIMTNMPPALDNTTSHSSVSDNTFTGTNRESCIPSEPPADVLQTPIIETDEATNIPRESVSNLKQSEEEGWKETSSLETENLRNIEEIEELCARYKLKYAEKAAMVNMLEMSEVFLSTSFFKEPEGSVVELMHDLKTLYKELLNLKKRSDKAYTDLKVSLSHATSQLGLLSCNLDSRNRLCSLLLDILLTFCQDKYKTLYRICWDFAAEMMTTLQTPKPFEYSIN